MWTWDAIKLKGPIKGVHYDLFVMLDIYSRKAVHHLVVPRESAALAKEFIEDAFRANGGAVPDVVHADRGTSMTSQQVAQLLVDLNIVRSHSRPRVSNDNPYSEANFRTLKYCPVFPDRFGSLADARSFCRRFFAYYNDQHRHSGIGLHTPASVHDGTARSIRARRAAVLAGAYPTNPGRCRRRPAPPRLPEAVWINEPTKEDRQEEHAA